MRTHALLTGLLIVVTCPAALAAPLLTWSWTPSPDADAQGHPLTPAAYYEVFMTCDNGPETLVATVTDTFWRHEPKSAVIYRFRVRAADAGGQCSVMSPYSTPWSAPAVAAVPVPLVPELESAYPNPFNPRTSIAYTVPTEVSGPMELRILDLQGRLVRTLPVDNSPGRHTADWNGTDGAGARVSSGVYLVRFRCGTYTSALKVTLTG